MALAGMGGTPVNNSAGKATKLPPPATALIPPPRAPAENRKMAVCRFKQKFYHERGSPAKERLFGGMKEGNESMMRALPDRSDFALSHFLTTQADPYMNGDILVPFRH